MNSAENAAERRVAWILLIAAPVGFGTICAFVMAGLAPGLDAGHPEEYLVATCVAWAIISLVVPILRLANLVSLPPILMGVIYFDMFFYVLGLCSGCYLNISWFGDFGHVVSSSIVTVIVFVGLCMIEAHSPAHVTFGNRTGMAIMLLLVALSFGGVWEMIEGFTDGVTGNAYMVYGASDTMGDLSADLIGAFIVSVGVYLYLGNHTASDISSKVRFGRKAFDIDETD